MDRSWPTDPQYRQHLEEMARTAGASSLSQWLDHVQRASPEVYASLQAAEQTFVAAKAAQAERLGIPFTEYDMPVIRYVPRTADDGAPS